MKLAIEESVLRQALSAFEKMPFQNSEMVSNAASALRTALDNPTPPTNTDSKIVTKGNMPTIWHDEAFQSEVEKKSNEWDKQHELREAARAVLNALEDDGLLCDMQDRLRKAL